jgi:hypothetical protein
MMPIDLLLSLLAGFIVLATVWLLLEDDISVYPEITEDHVLRRMIERGQRDVEGSASSSLPSQLTSVENRASPLHRPASVGTKTSNTSRATGNN